MGELKLTPLNNIHNEMGAKLVDFGGWEMPVQYSSILEEHNAVRNAAGLFDVSHMGEVYARGANAFKFCQNLVTNDINKLSPGKVLYTPMCNEEGGIIDDLLVYKKGENEFLIVVNASNIEKDFAWMQEHSLGAELENASDETAELALQGPKAQEILQKLVEFDLNSFKHFEFAEIKVSGVDALVSRTGYTGEDGFELYFSQEHAEKLWKELLKAGEEFGITPCGLGARDVLRLEAGLMLYGNDIDETTTPFEAPLKWTVKMDAGEFIGKPALETREPKRKLVGFEFLKRGVPRHGNPVFVNGEKFGGVTSGTFSPTLKKSIGMAYVPLPKPEEIQVEIRGALVPAKVTSYRFYKRGG